MSCASLYSIFELIFIVELSLYFKLWVVPITFFKWTEEYIKIIINQYYVFESFIYFNFEKE